jgi:signal transduction histidine kinase
VSHDDEHVESLHVENDRLRRSLDQQRAQERRLERSNAQLAQGVAHYVDNILTVVMGHLDMLEANDSADPRELERLHRIRAAVQQGGRLTTQLISYSGDAELERAPLDLPTTVTDALSLLAHRWHGSLGHLVTVEGTPAAVLVDRTGFILVLLALTVNALEAMPGGGTLRFVIRPARLDDVARVSPAPAWERLVALEVRDPGVGMSPEILARAFEPLFTTKDPSRWSGLGLAEARTIVAQHDGHLLLDSTPGEGTCALLLLPAVVPGDGSEGSADSAGGA